MNPQQQNQFALITVFANQAVVDYIKDILKNTTINHNNVELHLSAFNSLNSSQNMNAQIELLRKQIEEEIKKNTNAAQTTEA